MRWIAAACLLLLSGCATTPPVAEPPSNCAPVREGLRALQHRYGEQPIWQARTRDGTMTVLFLAPDGHGWTVVEIRGELACVVLSGVGWATIGGGEGA